MWRIWFVFVLFVISFSLIAARLYYWQVIAGDRLQQEASAQHYLEFFLPAQRGGILSLDGSPLVMNQPAFLTYAEPRKITDKEAFTLEVAKILSLDQQVLYDQLSDPARVWVAL